MNPINCKSRLIFAIIPAIAAFFTACGTSPSDISNVQVNTAASVTTNPGPEESKTITNCENSNPFPFSLTSTTSFKASVVIGSTATTSAGVEIDISGQVKPSLQTEIERSYQQTFNLETTRVEGLSPVTAPGREMIYTIKWKDEVYTSTVSFQLKGKTYTAPYTYTLRTVDSVTNKQGTSCPYCLVSGTVYNRDDNLPIANAAIGFIGGNGDWLNNREVYTAPDGTFTADCRGLKPEHFRLRLIVFGIRPCVGAEYQTGYYIDAGDELTDLPIYVPKSLIDSMCGN